jgi:rubrerythrin
VTLIPTRKELVRRLKDVQAVEIAARNGYLEDTVTFRNFKLKDMIGKIKKDEDKHIALLQELIDMLDKKN